MAADLFEAQPDAPVAAVENAAPDAAASISVATPAVPDETTPGLEKPRSSFTPWKHNQGFETTSPWCRLLTESPQIFQQLPYDRIIKTPPPDVQKLVHVERRAGDASTVAGASILASLSNLRQDLSRLKPTSQASGKDFKGSDLPSSPLLNEDDLDGQEVNSATNLESEAAADDGTANKSLPLDVNMETGGLEEERHWIKDPIPTPLSVMCSRGSAFREGLLAAILDGRHLEVTFDNFPYYLRFENIRTAKENILNSVAGVSPDGKYLSAIKDPYQVQKSNLEGLLQKHVEMAAEIKNLDTDLQMLMYENYNKFISATDTIKKMKNNIVGMETNMEQLLEKITSVQSRSDRVNTSLFEKGEHIEKLHRTHKLLRKVQFIYDLPTILQKCIKSEAYAEAVKFYTGVTPIFKAYGDSSFLDCKRASEEAVSIIIKNLQTWHFSFS